MVQSACVQSVPNDLYSQYCVNEIFRFIMIYLFKKTEAMSAETCIFNRPIILFHFKLPAEKLRSHNTRFWLVFRKIPYKCRPWQLKVIFICKKCSLCSQIVKEWMRKNVDQPVYARWKDCEQKPSEKMHKTSQTMLCCHDEEWIEKS